MIVCVPRSANELALHSTATSVVTPPTSTETVAGRASEKSSPGSTVSGRPSSTTRQISVPVPLSSQYDSSQPVAHLVGSSVAGLRISARPFSPIVMGSHTYVESAAPEFQRSPM